MKRKFSFILNIAIICVCVCAIAIGVWSAKRAELAVSGNIGFTANHCNANVTIKVENAALSASAEATTPLYVQNDNSGLKSTSSTIAINGENKSLSFGSMYFTDLPDLESPRDIVLTYTVTNTSNFPIVAYISIGEQFLINNPQVLAVCEDNSGTLLVGDKLATTLTDNDTVSIVLTLKCNKASGFTQLETINANSFTLKLEQAVVGLESDGFGVAEEQGEYYINAVPSGSGSIVVPVVVKRTSGSFVAITGIVADSETYIEEDYDLWGDGSEIVDLTVDLRGCSNLIFYETVTLATGLKTVGEMAFWSEYADMEHYDPNVGLGTTPETGNICTLIFPETINFEDVWLELEPTWGMTNLYLPRSITRAGCERLANNSYNNESYWGSLTDIYFQGSEALWAVVAEGIDANWGSNNEMTAHYNVNY